MPARSYHPGDLRAALICAGRDLTPAVVDDIIAGAIRHRSNTAPPSRVRS